MLKIVGDMPIYVGAQSADVWAHQELFELDDTGAAVNVAGVPPDAFSETGQLWGNPLYDWPVWVPLVLSLVRTARKQHEPHRHRHVRAANTDMQP